MDELIRDRIVFGVNNHKLREKLINEGEGLTLEKAIQVSQNFEYCKQQMNILNAKSSQDVNYVNNRGRGRVLGQGDRLQHQGTQIPPQQNRIKHNQSDKKKCSAYGKKCHLCKKYNHWRSVCQSKKYVHQVTNTISQMCVQDNSDEDDSWMDSYFL